MLDQILAQAESTIKDIPCNDDCPTEADFNAMSQQEVKHRKALYQYAKSKFETLHIFSRPDSLTRRDNVLILRRKLTVNADRQFQIEDWCNTVKDLFKGDVTIHKTDINRKHNLRLWFSPLFTSDVEFLMEVYRG